ncbi:MAG: hypothetical protein U1F53_19260 [Burkholderiaceae bacterium]
MTANVYEDAPPALLDAGMNAHLAKPIDRRRWSAWVRQWLGEPLSA